MSWKPTGEYMLVEKYHGDIAGLVLPDDMKVGEGDIFVVKAVGDGWWTDNGMRVSFEIQVGDRVMIPGKLLRVPGEKSLLVARQADVVCINRDEIPEKI